MSVLNETYTMLAIIGLACGIIASFFKDKLFKQEKKFTDREDIIEIIAANKEEHRKMIAELELRINTIIAANNVKVDLFWKIVEERIPRLLMVQKEKTN